ncbi:protein of unknown function [Methylocaldum szegediense]|uniref:Uncharacterized protein n=1 Tax=Methylocaldum szegediense TaxID=73780 RepID=A0ABN8X1W0_9GAMM|nr:protein of unknown function [Methylocaldum szegediense]
MRYPKANTPRGLLDASHGAASVLAAIPRLSHWREQRPALPMYLQPNRPWHEDDNGDVSMSPPMNRQNRPHPSSEIAECQTHATRVRRTP